MASDEKASTPAPSNAAPWTGERLKRQREQAHVSLQDIAAKTKIPASILAALEEARYADVPHARVYVRGFIRCYAQEVGLDPDEVARDYLPGWEAWFESEHRQDATVEAIEL